MAAELRPSLQLTALKIGHRIRSRADVVDRDGKFTLVNERLTPFEGMIDDLVFLRGVLDGAGIDFLLVRGNDERPVLAVDARRRDAFLDALSAASQAEPFYCQTLKAKTLDPVGPAVLVADGRPDGTPRILRLYRPRVDVNGHFAFGDQYAVQVEFWRWGRNEITVPIENALTRRRFTAAEVEHAEVQRWSRTWPTMKDMFADHASDVTFDIDIVFSWVDGTDKEWQRARAKRMESYVVGEGDDSEARFRQIDELKYALRSVYIYAPWVRRIFIVTDSPRPVWLDDHPRVTVVRSEEFFADTSVLPTHNSQGVESQLHHIDGLSEYFLYSNDDMFFGRPVRPDMFFSPGGVTKFIEATTRIGLGENNPKRSGFENAARVNRRLLQERFGRVTTRHLEHTATPLRRSVLFEMEREFAEDFTRTAASRFRSSTDISVTNSLYHYYALMTGRAVAKVGAKVLYVDTTMRSGLKQLNRLLKRRSHDFFCLNDGSFPEVTPEERARRMRFFLDRYFALPAPWEKPAVPVGAVDPQRLSQSAS